jgi:hypothetical protein
VQAIVVAIVLIGNEIGFHSLMRTPRATILERVQGGS